MFRRTSSAAMICAALCLTNCYGQVQPKCPNCLSQQAPRQPVDDLSMKNSVLEIFRELAQSRNLCLKAEEYLRRGKTKQAARLFQQVTRPIPGSRVDRTAEDRLQTIAFLFFQFRSFSRSFNPADGFESTASMVFDLLMASRKFFRDGNYNEAESSAQRALDLNLYGVKSHPVIYRIQLITLLREHRYKSSGLILGFHNWFVAGMSYENDVTFEMHSSLNGVSWLTAYPPEPAPAPDCFANSAGHFAR